MKAPKYPLQAAIQLREVQVQDAQTKLAAAIEAVANAMRALEHARQVVITHQRETEALIQKEMSDDRDRHPDEMVMFKHYLDRRKEERASLQKREEEMAEKLEQAKISEEMARLELAQAKTELKAVERHRERWEEELKKAAEERAELEAEDVVAGRRK